MVADEQQVLRGVEVLQQLSEEEVGQLDGALKKRRQARLADDTTTLVSMIAPHSAAHCTDPVVVGVPAVVTVMLRWKDG